MSTIEIEQRLARIRTLATSARNGHAINVGELGNEILTLDAQLADGATPPAAWRPKPLDVTAAAQYLASYDETCQAYRDEQDNPAGEASSEAYEEYEDGLTTVVHDLATALRAALAEIADLRRATATLTRDIDVTESTAAESRALAERQLHPAVAGELRYAAGYAEGVAAYARLIRDGEMSDQLAKLLDI